MNSPYRPFQSTLTQSGLNSHGLSLMMTPPGAALAGKVYAYLQIKADRSTPYPVMPDGTQAMYISPHGVILGGALQQAQDLQLLAAGEYFGLWFYPGGLRHFVDINLAEITDQFISAPDLQCRQFSSLPELIYRHRGFSARARACEAWLLKQYCPQPVTSFEHALQRIYHSFGNEKVTQLASAVGWSSRHLNRKFLQYTGLGTKAFSQVVRVQHAARQLYSQQNKRSDVALDLGYYDQPHLIKSFKRHLLSTPGEFMSDLSNRLSP